MNIELTQDEITELSSLYLWDLGLALKKCSHFCVDSDLAPGLLAKGLIAEGIAGVGIYGFHRVHTLTEKGRIFCQEVCPP